MSIGMYFYETFLKLQFVDYVTRSRQSEIALQTSEVKILVFQETSLV